MHIQLDTVKGLGLMDILAKGAGKKIENGILQMPESIGKGYIKKIDLGPMMSLMIHQYELHQDFTLDISTDQSKHQWITFSFRNILLQNEMLPCVQVSPADVNLYMFFPLPTKINTIIINIHRDLLNELVSNGHHNKMLQTIIETNQAFLYEEISSPAIISTACEILTAGAHTALQPFYYRIKAQELIWLFFNELLNRKAGVEYPVNVADLKIIYEMRDRLIADLSTSPNLHMLAASVHMSVSKVNRLFKQIFGVTIYNYHQKLRIKKAADLIKVNQYSVSEAGHEVGYSNLSHFSRIFSKHIGIKPKKFSSTC
jgi:AraC-like DNA-binding protein